jgi:hypothetical protein
MLLGSVWDSTFYNSALKLPSQIGFASKTLLQEKCEVELHIFLGFIWDRSTPSFTTLLQNYPTK